MLQIDIQGLDQVQDRLRTVLAQIGQAAPRALFEEGSRIMNLSHDLVPIDTGLLRSTGYVAQPVLDGQGATVELSYGARGMAPYAPIIEFDTAMNHPRGGQALYLSEPFFAAPAHMLERLATAIRTAMGS